MSVNDGLDSHMSSYSAPVTMDRLESAAVETGMRIFTRIDHTAEAARVNKTLRPTALLIFGNPKAGTLLMQESQTAGLDLPLRALAWEDAEGQVWLTLNTTEYLAARHGITGQQETLHKMTAALKRSYALQPVPGNNPLTILVYLSAYSETFSASRG